MRAALFLSASYIGDAIIRANGTTTMGYSQGTLKFCALVLIIFGIMDIVELINKVRTSKKEE